jgi:hypothetical protein
MPKYKVCIIESKKTKKRFIEYTDKKLTVRTNELNKGRKVLNKWLLKNRPFKIVYCETHDTKKESIERVNFLKYEREMSPDIFDRRIKDRRKENMLRFPDRRLRQRRVKKRRTSDKKTK